jgi:hypothetical protein
LLVDAGAVLLLNSLGYLRLDLGRLWPLFPLAPGLFFVALHLFSGAPATRWALIPGLIITNVAMVLFLISFDLVDMGRAWPSFPFAVGLAFLEMYALGLREDAWPLIPGTILTGLGLVFFITEAFGWEWWPLLLVAAGLVVLFSPRPR